VARPTITTPKIRRRLEITAEAAVASVAVTLSVLTLATSAWFAIRGSVVTAVPPDSVFFYRDAGDGAGAVLTAGVDTSLVNSASGNYGDVVTGITMEIDQAGDEDPTFNYGVLVTPVFSEHAVRQAAACPVTARCVVNDGQFLTIEEPRRTLDVPGGASRSEYVGFVLQATNCARKDTCGAFTDFAAATRLLERSPTIVIRFRYSLHSDGEKVAVCRLDLRALGQSDYRPWLAEHLNRKGWVQLPCARTDPAS
jgi:hypothetical protein